MATVIIDTAKLLEYYSGCKHPATHYGLGCKAHPVGSFPPHFIDRHGAPVHAVDCSGFVRAALYHATNLDFLIPDGSVVQHDYFIHHAYTKAPLADCGKQDGKVRIAFLAPADAPEGIGHVVLTLDGETIESHAPTGPDRRAWGSRPWMSKMHAYLLT